MHGCAERPDGAADGGDAALLAGAGGGFELGQMRRSHWLVWRKLSWDIHG